ncbi:hypothetical protein FRB93_012317 [Tulasnella sp. JGI-2019a]|nr:hypothetical protein FRB93_012317 [Tulasnella sp. JGI-2019a]
MPPVVPGDIPVGAIVEVQAGKGIVRFHGTTSFAPGRWIGIELPEPNGKNDGSVDGVPYFSCKMKYGVFVRATQIKSVELQSNAAPPPPPLTSRPTHKSNGSISGSFTPPTPGRTTSTKSIGSSRAASPQKISPVPLVTRPRIPPPTPLKRTSYLQSSASPGQPSPSRVPSTPGLARQLSTTQQQVLSQLPSRRQSILQPTLQLPSQTSSVELNSPVSDNTSSLSSSPLPNALHVDLPSEVQQSSPRSIGTDGFAPPPPDPPNPPPVDDSHELRVKLRVLETKRADDSRRIRELEGRLNEAEAFVSIRPKLQAKLQQLNTETVALKRTITDQASQLASLERKNEEQSEQLEMAMLDREVAEERAEVAESELEGEREAKAELEVELEVWRKVKVSADGSGADGGDDTSGGRTEMAFRQLEKQNARLKEALIRLRDLTHETDAEQRRRIADLEKELTGVDDMQAQYAQTLARLEQAENQVDDLKEQLDDALGAEEVLVQLTERNLIMGERIEEMRITIEDLEALRELNDELEETHVETEKALQDEIEQKDTEIREQHRKVEVLQEALQEYENTVQQFRELVTNLQVELESLRVQHQTRQTESQAQASQSAALMSLNMRLQSSALKNQAKNIDLELKKLEAKQAKEMLGIVQPYLPQVYIESDSNATNCYMFFQRMAYKLDLINSIVASQYGLPDSINGTVSEKLVGICDMRGRIAHLAALCKRSAAVLRYSDPEMFLSSGQVYPEIAPLEKRVDIHINLLAREEFREYECMHDVAKMILQVEHLADTSFAHAESDLGERELDLASQIDCDLDTFHATIGLTKAVIESALNEDDVTVELGDLDMNETLFKPLQSLVDQSKAPRLTSTKVLKVVEDLVSESSAVKIHVVTQWVSIVEQVRRLVDLGIPLAQEIGAYVSDVRAQKHSFQLSAVLALVRKVVGGVFGNKTSPWKAVAEAIGNVAEDVATLLPLTIDPENVVKITGQSPWITRVDEIKTIAAVNLDAERSLTKLNDEILTLVKEVKTREQIIQESGAKIELMERRMEAVKKQGEAIIDLEAQVEQATKQEKEWREAVDSYQAEIEALDEQCHRLKQQLESVPNQSTTGTQPVEGDTTMLEGNLETSYLLEQVESLRGAVRFLRSENSYLKGQDLLRDINSLPVLASFAPPTPPLSPSSSASTDLPAPPSPERPTLRSLTTESKMLYRDVINFSSSVKVVDLTKLNDGKSKGWIPQKATPAGQLWSRQMEGEKLGRRVRGLVQRANNLTLPVL